MFATLQRECIGLFEIYFVEQAVQQAPRPADHYQRAAVGSCHGFAGVLMIRTNTCTTSIATFVQFIG